MLEELLTEVFWKAAIRYNPNKIPNSDEIKQVVNVLAETMRDLKLTIIPSHLLPPLKG